MRTSKTFTALLTTVAFLTNGLGGVQVQAQTGPAAGVAGQGTGFQVPTYTPIIPNFTMAMDAYQQKIRSCDMDALSDNPKVNAGLDRLKGMIGKDRRGKDISLGKTAQADSCSDFEKPDFESTLNPAKNDENTAKMCSKTCNVDVQDPDCSELKDGDGDEVSLVKYKAAKAKLQSYKNFLMYKSKHCPSDKMLALKKQFKAYQCSMDALTLATEAATHVLQTTLDQNNQMYAKQVQDEKELNQTVVDIEKLLGPDPTLAGSGANQFQGLLGMQKALTQSNAKLIEDQAKFHNRATQMKTDFDANEQTLVSERMAQQVSCLKEDSNHHFGGIAKMCFKPKMKSGVDASGKPTAVPALDASGNVTYSKQTCSDVESLRSQVEQSAFTTSRGVIRSQARTQQAEEYAAQFDKIIRGMESDMSEPGKDTRWEALASKRRGDMDRLSSLTGVNVAGELGKATRNCENVGEKWRKQQLRLNTSPYSKAKKELTDKKVTLAAEINSGLSEVSRNYADAYAVLGNTSVALNRDGCTYSDPTIMNECYSRIGKQVQDLLEGGAGKANTSFPMKLGTKSLPPVSCSGINGCITTLKARRKLHTDQIEVHKSQRQEFARLSNDTVQRQVSSFGKYLGNLQQSLRGRFASIQQGLRDMSASGGGNLKFIPKEQLKAAMGKDEIGPFESTSNLTGVLSAATQPEGLLDFSNSGIDALMKNQEEKDSTNREAFTKKIDDVTDSLKKYSGDFFTSCNSKDVANDSKGIGCTALARSYEMNAKKPINDSFWCSLMDNFKPTYDATKAKGEDTEVRKVERVCSASSRYGENVISELDICKASGKIKSVGTSLNISDGSNGTRAGP